MNGATNHKSVNRSIREACKITLQSQGARGLYRGLFLRLVAYMPLHSYIYLKISSDMMASLNE